MKLDVKRNTKRNIVFGVIHKMILMIMPFIVRAVIRNMPGVQYLGLNTLFSSILQVLSVTEICQRSFFSGLLSVSHPFDLCRMTNSSHCSIPGHTTWQLNPL